MGYHHCHIPPIEACIKQYTILGLEAFAKRYAKCEMLVGDTEAIQFVNDKISEWLNNKRKQ